MAEAQSEAQNDADGQETNAWAQQQPVTRIKVSPTELIYGGELSETTAQNDTSFGLRTDSIEVINGSLFANDERDDFETTAEAAEEADSPRATDFRIVDEDDSSANVKQGFLFTNEELGDYSEAESSVTEDTVIWYNGMSGQMVGRTLDFNGMPFARFTEDGYLVKGLLQVAEGWRQANRGKRSDMAKDGKAPRVARVPFLRSDVEEVIIDVSRYNGGRMYEVHIFDATDVDDESADIEDTGDGFTLDGVEELGPKYNEEADDFLEGEDGGWAMYHGAGWADEPADSELRGNTEVSLDVNDGDGEETGEDGFTTPQRNLIDSFEDALAGTGHRPDSAFDGGLESALPRYSDAVGGEENLPAVEDVRRELYARLSHLDTEELEE